MFRPPFDPSLWFLACDDGSIAGFCLCKPADAEDFQTGWIPALGVRREWRRRGLASALLHHAFGELRRLGKRAVVLGVDAESSTGALELYERAGMRVSRRFVTYEKAL